MDTAHRTAPATPDIAEDAPPFPLLDGIPQQRAAAPVAADAPLAGDGLTGGADSDPVAASGPEEAAVAAPADPLARLRTLRPWRLLPTPTGTPFTFFYAVVLGLVSVVSEHIDPALVHSLRQGSSTDVAHLLSDPMLVLPASALWIVGGLTSPYAIVFLLVLTALERRTGATYAAGVFLLGHVLATLATEVPVGVAVWAGHLPDSSLHRLDYGISFGVAASVGALAGLLTPWLRWPLLTVFGATLLDDLIAFTDPLTNWGHLLALATGIATWPLLRRRRR
ncbi:rhomboid-like protein [Streptomyces sp. R21]|uniref:Rhomboid-like protein n=1 Tax=Streptomyces sp. R21 TaxID=3238627 RepID=A0AB39P6H7_9ACTN